MFLWIRLAVLSAENFQAQLVKGSIVDGRRSNRLQLRASIDSTDSGIEGDDLWKMKAYGSTNSDGSGVRYNELDQVLTNLQQDTGVAAHDTLNFVPIGLNFDMEELGCSEVKYICLELQRDPSSSVIFSLESEGGLTRCMELRCEGELFHQNQKFSLFQSEIPKHSRSMQLWLIKCKS